MKPRHLLLLLLLAPLLLAAGGCVADRGQAKEPDVERLELETDERIPVAALPLMRGHIESVLRLSTHFESESEVEVYAQASRRVTELLVEEGQSVRKGQLLLRLKDDEQKTALARVESQLAQAQRELDRQQKLYSPQLSAE